MKLSNDLLIPDIGFGVFQIPDGEATQTAVQTALEVGYRHIDTAAAYGNEAAVGKAIKESGVKREDIFLTTKHWVTERGYDKTLRAVENSLQKLGTDYLDLYLIHWPLVEKASLEWKEVNLSTWKGFEKLYKEGVLRSIGVSNFLPHHLQALMDSCEIAPQVNQIEFHPGYTQMETVDFCQQNDILVQAWSPLGSGRLISHPWLADIAARYGKTSAQLCLRYALQHHVLPLAKTVNRDRMLANLQIFDFEISPEDMRRLDETEQAGYSGWHPDDAPAETYYD